MNITDRETPNLLKVVAHDIFIIADRGDEAKKNIWEAKHNF